jgi:hypothetical protein
MRTTNANSPAAPSRGLKTSVISSTHRCRPRTVFGGAALGLTLIGLALTTGCVKRAGIDDADARGMVELLMPQRVELVEAFTQFKSFDRDEVPDGIEVLVHALDAFGDPVKIAGTIRFELYDFVPASGERAGRRLCAPWEVTLVTREDQQRYWNLVTGMYEIPLKFPPNLPVKQLGTPGRKFLLEATYTTPLGTHMTDECVLAAPRLQ